MNEKLYRAIEDFITQRMDDLGADAPAYVAETITEVGCCAKKLEETLMESQFSLWRELEDALSRQTGEEMRYYYRAGFHDAVRFLDGTTVREQPGAFWFPSRLEDLRRPYSGAINSPTQLRP